MKYSLNVTVAALAIAVLTTAVHTPAALAQDAPSPFETLLEKVQSNPAGASEDDVLKMISAARDEGRDYTASLAIKGYLANHFRPSAELLLASAQIAHRVGDFPTAVGRYKGYLGSARPNAASSNAAAELYALLIDVLGAHEDAYQTMAGVGAPFRQSDAARRFDHWFVRQAAARKDHAALAARLVAVFSEKQPLERERLYYWDELDWLMNELAAGRDEKFAALNDAQKLVGLVRGDVLRAKRFAFYVAHHAHRAGGAGKDETAMARSFRSQVEKPAQAYFDAAPTAATLKDIFATFNGGYNDRTTPMFDENKPLKQALIASLVPKLAEAQRDQVLNWRVNHQPAPRFICTPQQWAAMGAKLADYFGKSRFTHNVPFVHATGDAKLIASQAAFLKGVASNDAAVINALASSKDFTAMVNHLMRQGSWHMSFTEPYQLIRGDLWNAYRKLQGEDAKIDNNIYHKAIFAFGKDHVATTPIAYFDRGAASEYMLMAWRFAGDDANKDKVIPHIEALAWLPYDDRARRDVFGRAHGEFRRWADMIRRDAKSKEPKYDEKVVAQIGQIDKAFKAVMDRGDGDASKAPNKLCKAFAEAVLAERKKRGDDFIKAARAMYAEVKDYDAKRPPVGEASFRWALTGQAGELDNLDFQLEVLAEHLKGYRGDGTDRIVNQMPGLIFANRRHWGHWRIWDHDREAAAKIAGVYEKALLAQMDKNKFSNDLFYQMRAMRAGSRGRAEDVGVAAMERIIKEKTLLKENPAGATVQYMDIVRHHFAKLHGKYPPERYFDTMLIEEAKLTGKLDYDYWRFGRDEKKVVANAAAEILAGYATLPLGYGDGAKSGYDAGNLFQWHDRALNAEPAQRDNLVAALEANYGKGRWDVYAMGRSYFSAVGSVKDETSREAYFKRLGEFVSRSGAAADRVSLPYLGALGAIQEGKQLTDDELAVLLRAFDEAAPVTWHGNNGYEHMALRVAEALIAKKRELELFDLNADLWRIAAQTGNTNMQRDLAKLAARVADLGRHDLALVMTDVGEAVFRGGLPEDVRTRLVGIRGRAVSNIGGVIPVKKSDPRYPVFAAQSNYLTGRTQAAWEGFAAKRQLAMSMLRDLDPSFLIWTIDRSVELGRFDEADEMAKQMIQWFDSVSDGIEPELRARLLLSYANIASARKEFPRARALYERIAAAEEFKTTRTQREAEIKVAEVDRITGRYDEAIDRLTKLARRNDVELQAMAHYHMALVRFDQGEFVEAGDAIQQVFARAPGHPDARILEGKVNLKLKKLEEPTEIQVGTVTQKRFIVPGKPLKVAMEDKNLSIVGKSVAIEIRAWTDSGDEEFFPLTPFGDSRTKFMGELATEMAPLRKGDSKLQVLGEDVVHYDFSERFKRENRVTLGSPASLAVTTNAALVVSSGVILSKEDREQMALEALIRKRLQQNETEYHQQALSTRRSANQIKPGNPINVRVVDPDRSLTDKIDEVRVRVTSSSGDRINGFVLKETEPHSGVFEGGVPTAAGQAIAFASDTEDGKEPNFAISGKDYPAWVGLPDSRKPKWFAVDFNDNIALKTMNITADEPGRKITSLLVQTSLNGKRFTTVGSYPKAYQPWDGKLQVELVRYGNFPTGPRNIDETLNYLEQGYLAAGLPKVKLNPKDFKVNWGNNPEGKYREMKLGTRGGPGGNYIAHFRGAFFNERRQVRVFKPQLGHNADRDAAPRVFFTINGESPRRNEAGEYRVSLEKGVHTLEVFIAAATNHQTNFNLLVDTPEPPYMVPAPAAMFDIEANPLIRQGVYREPAAVAGSDDGGAFRVDFPEDADARVVRLLIRDFEADAPAISAITLTDRADKAVLPTQRDFLDLRKNDTLEIVPGDRVSIVYEDPRVVSAGDELHEAFMDATYANAALSAAFVETELRGDERIEQYITMRRFEPGDVINVFINDPDMDESDELDKVPFTVRVFNSEPIELLALETEVHSGVFIGKVFPVAGEPSRQSEITVKPGDDVKIEYTDQHNTDPGIPWSRTVSVEQVWYDAPEMRVYDVTSRPLNEEEAAAVAAADAALADTRVEEWVPATKALQVVRPEAATPEGQAAQAVIGGSTMVEVLFPAIAKSANSRAVIYAQTSSGRALQPAAQDKDFDITVPGTIKITATPGGGGGFDIPKGYLNVTVRQDQYAQDALTDGRFTFAIPMQLATTPPKSMAMLGELEERLDEHDVLAVNGTDTVYIGFEFKDDKGQTRWITREIQLTGDAFMDVMERRYQEHVEGLYVGETLYFRVIDRKADVSDDKDTIQLELTSTSGTKQAVELTETFSHSGIFKGLARIVHTKEAAEGVVEIGDFPAAYGDKVTITYTPSVADAPPLTRSVQVFKGADGDVMPFTKRFKDPAIAVQTQFTVAEAYFELAKRHRVLGEEDVARAGIQQGKKLLEEAIRDFPNIEARAQADYLLAELSLEFANDAENVDQKKKHYTESLNRFSDIVSSYPDSPYAPKSQYKKALVYEKMAEFDPPMIDKACEEYVKLSYRYPENELVAETIARLGQYFLTKGRGLKEQAEAEAAGDPVEAEKVRMQSSKMFTTAAEVFSRLSVRFPQHNLAGKTLVLSAQCYMQAGRYDKAIGVFKKVIETPDMDSELVAESMYWAGDCYMNSGGRGGDLVSAYRMFKKLTWDYPASKWARYARGRLTDERLAKIDAEGS